jgi:hypothetical protein
MSNPYPKPNLIFGLPSKFNSQDFSQIDSSCDCSNGYIQSIYNDNVINYDGTNTIYLNSSITLPSGIWQINYNFPIGLFSNHVTIVFLSTSNNPSTAIANRLVNSQTIYKNNSSGTGLSLVQCSNSFVLSVPQTTIYYLYGVINQSAPAGTAIFNNNITGTTDNPDSSIILSAIFIK